MVKKNTDEPVDGTENDSDGMETVDTEANGQGRIPGTEIKVVKPIIEDAKKTIGIVNKIAIARMLEKVDGPTIEARKVASDALGKAWVEQKKQEFEATRPRNLL